jgi:hypothetical protein
MINNSHELLKKKQEAIQAIKKKVKEIENKKMNQLRVK